MVDETAPVTCAEIDMDTLSPTGDPTVNWVRCMANVDLMNPVVLPYAPKMQFDAVELPSIPRIGSA